jgi:SH3-like domain-containing protein
VIIFPGFLASIFTKISSGISSLWREQHILSGSLAVDSDDEFGWSVAMNSAGDRIIVGARLDEAVGANDSSGLAYVYISGSSGWTQQQILSGSLATGLGDQFAHSVAINSTGDRVIVGANADEGGGRAYIFVSGASGWIQQQILSGSLATASSDNFGWSVAMNSVGNCVVVGAINDERTSTNGEGLAYVFVSGTNGWSQQHILSGSFATFSSDGFGYSVAMNSNGDRVIIGAFQDERVLGSSGEGLAYIYVSGNIGWVEQQVLSGSLAIQTNDRFGYSVAMNSNGDRVIVGAYQDEAVSALESSGLAYIFVSGAGGWTQQQILSGSLATGSFDNFGSSVAMNSIGDCVVVGATGDEPANGLDSCGAAYVYISGTTGWTQQHILSGSLATQGSEVFGVRTSINSSGNCIIIGASLDEKPFGNLSTGLAYIFQKN